MIDNNSIVALYIHLLKYASIVGRFESSYPAVLLPSDHSTLRMNIESSNLPSKDALIDRLEMFNYEKATRTSFIVGTAIYAAFLSLPYSIWILYRGGNWYWVGLSIIGSIGVGLLTSLILTLADPNLATRKRLLRVLIPVLQIFSYIPLGIILLRLFFYSGLYGTYSNIFIEFGYFTLLLSILSIYLSIIFKRYLNAVLFFTYSYGEKYLLNRERDVE